MLLLPIFVVSLVVFVLYRYLSANYDYWRKKGVPNPPVSVLFGNLKDSVFMRKSLGQLYHKIYKDYPQCLYVGFFKMRQPAILVRDAELLQTVLLKNFSSFHDNDIVVDEKVDPIFAKSFFAEKGEKWNVSRAQATPCFSNKRIKVLYPLIEEVGKNLVKYLTENPGATGEDGLETKELAAKFTTDVSASCAFGIEGRAFTDPESELRKIGTKVFSSSLKKALTSLFVMVAPPLATFLDLKFFPDDVEKFFQRIVKQTLQYKKENKGALRGDFLDVMMELRAKQGDKFNDEYIVPHSAVFFTDGLETSSVSISFTLYELATNLDVQANLREEITETLARTGGRLDFDEIQAMPYLEKVVKESFRKDPPIPFIARVCTKPFKFPPPTSKRGKGRGEEVEIEAGTSVFISVDGIHHDPQYYEDPEKFDPERFANENRSDLTKYTSLGFGEGPRTCLGKTFGIIQVKVAVVSIIAKFEVRLNKKTIDPLQIDPQSFMRKVKGGIWLNFYKLK